MTLLARLLNPIVWRLPGRDARKLFSFARAEHGSMIDLQQAARATASAERASMYLRHASDEARHARMFANRSAELRRARGARSFGHPRADTEDLFDNLGELGFLAFVHRGERRGRAQFEVYRDYFARRGLERNEALFTAIIADEQRHERYTYELLVELAGGEKPAAVALKRSARWEAWRTWRRLGRAVVQPIYGLLMTVLYLVSMPLALLVRVVRPVRAGWRPPAQLTAPENPEESARGSGNEAD